LVNEQVVSKHAEEAAFLWTMRDRAVREPHYALNDVVALDQRVHSHLDGLVVAGEAGWKACKTNLHNLGPGEVFALGAMAFATGDRARMTTALHAGSSSPDAKAGLVSALGWLDYDDVSRWIARLLDATSPAHRSIGIAASAIHRKDPGTALNLAISDPEPALRARALRAIGELKRRDLLDHVRGHVKEENEACRFWAGWSLTLNGDRAGLDVLLSSFELNSEFTFPALQLALRALSLDDSRRWISMLAKEPTQAQLAVMGTGIVGDPISIPWLIRRMENPDLAQLAGEAFTMITGVDLEYADLDQPAPSETDLVDDSIEKVLDLNYESNLRWPSPALVAGWWDRNQSAFSTGIRYLSGKPITPQTAFEVLVGGKQRQRAAAALQLALLDRDRLLFEVRAPGHHQQRKLAEWTS
jgi:uncharacterized protein (TIGR02270 family)